MQRGIGTLVVATFVTAAIGVWAQGSARNARNQVAPGDWPNLNRDLAATRYSPLTEINTGNVSSLERAWTLKLGGGATSVPLVVSGVMYVSSGPRVVAVDAVVRRSGRTRCHQCPPHRPRRPNSNHLQLVAAAAVLPLQLRRRVASATGRATGSSRRACCS